MRGLNVVVNVDRCFKSNRADRECFFTHLEYDTLEFYQLKVWHP